MMKYLILVFAIIFGVEHTLLAQKKKTVKENKPIIAGLWRIDHLIGDEREHEFYLCAPEIMPCPKPYTVPIYGDVVPGKTLLLNADKTFKSEYTDGDEKVLRLMGTYEFVGNDYIRFKVQDTFLKGIEKPRIKIEEDTSLFYIHKDQHSFRLFRSEGNLAADKKLVQYSNIVSPIRCDPPSPTDEKSKLIWYDVDGRDKDAAIACCLSAFGVEEYEYIYQQRSGWMRIYMISVGNEYWFVVHHPFRKKVTLDPRKVSKI